MTNPRTHPSDDLEPYRSTALDRRRVDAGRRIRDRRERTIDIRRLALRFAENQRLKSSRLGYPTVQAARLRYDHLDAVITADGATGSTLHHRLPWLVRQVPRVVALIDWVVLIPFCAELFNPDPEHPLQTVPAWAATLLLALMASGVTYCWLAVTGTRLKVYRDELGEIALAAAGATTGVMLAGCAVLVFALGTLMYLRITYEVLQTGGQIPGGAAMPVALVFATVGAIANATVIAVHALDGSVVSEEHRRTGRLLRQHERTVERHQAAALQAAIRTRVDVPGVINRDDETPVRDLPVEPRRSRDDEPPRP